MVHVCMVCKMSIYFIIRWWHVYKYASKVQVQSAQNTMTIAILVHCNDIKSTHHTNYICIYIMWDFVQTSRRHTTTSMYYRTGTEVSLSPLGYIQYLLCTPVQCTNYTLVWVFIRQKCFPTSIGTVVPPDQLHLSKTWPQCLMTGSPCSFT